MLMKKLLLTSIALIALHLGCYAEEFTVGGLRYKTLTDNTVEVIGYSGTDLSEIKVLELVRYNGVIYSVASIKDGALSGCGKLVSVIIPEGSTTFIGKDAFKNCVKLESINIPEGVISIGDNAFFQCANLKSVYLPKSLRSMGSYAFYRCRELTSVTIPKNVESIAHNSFYECENLTSVTISNGVKSIQPKAFENCRNLGSINIPGSVNSIGEEAFFNCSNVTNINISNGVKSIGRDAFSRCSKVTSLYIPNSVTEIVGNPFAASTSNIVTITVENGNSVYDSRENCNAIIETASNKLIVGCNYTVIPNNITAIGEYAFEGCEKLTVITLPEGISSIEGFAFHACKNLTSINLPKELTYIGEHAFFECSRLASIYIPNGVTTISGHAFSYCSMLTSVSLPYGLTSIENSAFYQCNLNSITLPSTITYLGRYAFQGNANLDVTCLALFPPQYQGIHIDNYIGSAGSFDKTAIFHIPCESLDYYNVYWSAAIEKTDCIGATPFPQTQGGVSAVPKATSVIIKWDVEVKADYYEITLTKNGENICYLKLGSDGTVLKIEYYVPTLRGGSTNNTVTNTAAGYGFEVTQLEPNTRYTYTVATFDSNDLELKRWNSWFETLDTSVNIEKGPTYSKIDILTNNKYISVSGTEPSDIKIYNTAGQQVGNPVPAAGVYVVKVGDETVKVLVK